MARIFLITTLEITESGVTTEVVPCLTKEAAYNKFADFCFKAWLSKDPIFEKCEQEYIKMKRVISNGEIIRCSYINTHEYHEYIVEMLYKNILE